MVHGRLRGRGRTRSRGRWWVGVKTRLGTVGFGSNLQRRSRRRRGRRFLQTRSRARFGPDAPMKQMGLKKRGRTFVSGHRSSGGRHTAAKSSKVNNIPMLRFKNTYTSTDSPVPLELVTMNQCAWFTGSTFHGSSTADIIRAELEKRTLGMHSSAGNDIFLGDDFGHNLIAPYKILNTHVHYTAKNQTNHTEKLEVFLLRARIDGGATLEQPIVMHQSGLVEKGGTNTDYLDPNAKLNDSLVFKTAWKIVDSKKFILGAGDIKTWSYDLGAMNVTHEYRQLQAAHSNTVWANRSYKVMMKLTGEIAHSIADEELIGMGFGRVDMIRTFKTTYEWYPFQHPRATVVNTCEGFADPRGFHDNDVVLAAQIEVPVTP